MFKRRYSAALQSSPYAKTDNALVSALQVKIMTVDAAYRQKALEPFVPCVLRPADVERIEGAVFQRCHDVIVGELRGAADTCSTLNPYYEYVQRMQSADDSIWKEIFDLFVTERIGTIEIDANEAEIFHVECHIKALERIIQIYGADAQANPDSADTMMFALRLVLPLIASAPSTDEFVARRRELLHDKFVSETSLLILDAYSSSRGGIPGAVAAQILYGVGRW